MVAASNVCPGRRHPGRAAPAGGALTDPDAIGPDGTLRLRCYLPQQDSVWFSAICGGATGCRHLAPISVLAAILRMGSGEATVRQLAGRLHCSECGGQQVSITLQSDVRPFWIVQRDGPRAETRAGLPD